MQDLSLEGVHEDGEHLVLRDGGGTRFRVPVDDAMRAAVRRDRPRLGQLQLEMDGRLRPRDIQARIRAGATAEEVAESAGLPIEHVRRYEGPVIAERDHMVSQAKTVPLRRRAGGSPSGRLGEVVSERLAARGVHDEEDVWDAWRRDDGTWTVQASFKAGSKQRRARWAFDPANRTVEPSDDEARWLSTPPEPEGPPARRLTSVGAAGTPEAVCREGDTSPTEDLGVVFGISDGLARPANLRRIRPAEPGGEPPAAHPAPSRADEAWDAEVVAWPATDPAPSSAGVSPESEHTAPEPAAEATGAPARPRAQTRTRGRRSSVPSWDEIVFGGRRE